ncbi:MAG: GntR family transcriptional regulator [Clostridia bacterium]
MPRIRSDAAEVAAKKILDMINDHKLVTGDSVSDMELSRDFEMSRTPIREGIITLIEAGVLERTRTKVVVKSVTMDDVIEILDVRDAIERKTIEIIFERDLLTEEKIQKLQCSEDMLAKNIKEGNFDANFNSDTEFHQTLISFAENQRFVDIYNRLSLQFSRLRWMTMLTPSRYVETKSEHQVIIDTLKTGDMDKSIKAANSHIIKTKENYNEILTSSYWNHIADEIKRMKQS